MGASENSTTQHKFLFRAVVGGTSKVFCTSPLISHLKCRLGLYSTSFKLEVYNSALPIVADRVYLFLDRVIGVKTCEIALNIVVVPYPLKKVVSQKGVTTNKSLSRSWVYAFYIVRPFSCF